MYEMLSQVANDETSPSLLMSLPHDLIMDIIARVSRFNYAALSLTRGDLCSAPLNIVCLAPTLSLPPMPVWASYDVVGSNIFVMGGLYDRFNWPPVINDKINVIGKSVDEPSYAPESRIIMVFDTRTETWEHGTKPVSEKDPRWFKSFPPTSDKWDTDEILHYKYHGCVIDDIMYRYKRGKNILITYDLKQRIWGEVKGLEKLPLISSKSEMISCGKKLILFLEKGVQKREIWCAKISVERREGEIWGKIECYDLLLDGCFCFFHC
ncbi:Kelch-type beta propeller, partial [Arabidopsis suecica]